MFQEVMDYCATARQKGEYKDVLLKYAKPTLLILDEWLMLPPTESEKKDIFELLHRRRRKSSTIFCSQVDPNVAVHEHVYLLTSLLLYRCGDIVSSEPERFSAMKEQRS